jgi:hypothetical protein
VPRICIQARPLESNEDRFSVEGILGIELAAAVLELPKLRRIEDTVFNVRPVKSPIVRLRNASELIKGSEFGRSSSLPLDWNRAAFRRRHVAARPARCSRQNSWQSPDARHAKVPSIAASGVMKSVSKEGARVTFGSGRDVQIAGGLPSIVRCNILM